MIAGGTSLGAKWHLGFRPDLDGLRGLAILLVLLGHSRLPLTDRAGNIGVVVFFVLSGFLITSLLLEEYAETGRVALAGFYQRRARRLLPALLVFLAVIAVALVLLGRASELSLLLPPLLYYANWPQAFGDPGLNYVGHTWSLSVEEQFYLVWPILLLALLRLGRLRMAAAIVVLLIIGSTFLRIALAADEPRAGVGTDTRMDALMIGALIGMIATSGRLPDIGRRWAILALGAIVLMLPIRSSHFVVIAGFSLAAIASAVLVIHATRGGSWLALKPLRDLGRISYGVYLWHFPLMIALRPQLESLPILPRTALAALLIAVALALATTSWFLVERRFLGKRRREAMAPNAKFHAPAQTRV
jgi:peptidoglycan/LPS O-acetylase OafA/YrhL